MVDLQMLNKKNILLIIKLFLTIVTSFDVCFYTFVDFAMHVTLCGTLYKNSYNVCL